MHVKGKFPSTLFRKLIEYFTAFRFLLIPFWRSPEFGIRFLTAVTAERNGVSFSNFVSKLKIDHSLIIDKKNQNRQNDVITTYPPL